MSHDPTPKLCECGCGEPAPIASTSSERWKRTKGEPQRFVAGHNHRPLGPVDPPRPCECGCGGITRIVSKRARRFLPGHNSRDQAKAFDTKWRIDDESGCHVWTGRVSRYGYGMFGDQLAHRVAWIRERGPVPEGLELDHLCGNRLCINLVHLEPVTRAENCRRGRQTKLTIEQVRFVKASDRSNGSLGREFGVSTTTISCIRRGVSWRGVE